jgi:hypothetical protein
MTTDILDLPGWTVLAKRLEDREYELEAEYTVKPTACQKCGVLDRLYRHGTKDTIYRDSPIRGHATRILARVQLLAIAAGLGVGAESGEERLGQQAVLHTQLVLVSPGLDAHAHGVNVQASELG